MEKCSLCNTEFKNKYSLGNHLRYGCTNSSEYQSSVRIKKIVYIECKECHIIFEVPYAKRRRKFCSTKCYGIWITGNNNPCKKKGRYINCLVCGKEIYVTNRNINRKYCSYKCFYENNKGDNHSSRRPEVGKKIGDWKKKNHHCAGKTYEECYGVEKAREIKNKMKKNEEARQKIGKANRLNIIKRVELALENGGQLAPWYNPTACEYFNNLMEQTGTHIQHAENGGEYLVKGLGYFVDGYDSENNIIYEYDEKHHFNYDGTLREEDIKRQQEIEEYHPECTFIRIKDRDVPKLKIVEKN